MFAASRSRRVLALAIPATLILAYLEGRRRRQVPFVSAESFAALTLVRKRMLTPTVHELAFALPQPLPPLADVPAAFWVKDDPLQIARPYTAINDPTMPVEELVFAVREYADGQMSRFLCRKRVGDKVDWRGPISADWNLAGCEAARPLLLLAGGTGITPMVQIIRASLASKDLSQRRIQLLYACRNDEEILLREELDALAKIHPRVFSVTYFVEQTSREGDPGIIPGRIAPNHLEAALEAIQRQSKGRPQILVSGPDGMMRAICGEKPTDLHQGPVRGMLGQLGLDGTTVYKL